MSERAGRAQIRMTRRMRRVLLVLLTGAPRLSGYPICRAAGIASGGAYVALARLERAGWVDSERDDGPEPRRRFYRLTPDGRACALAALGLQPPTV